MALKLTCVSECLEKWFSKFLKKRNLTTIPFIPLPEYGQSNAILNLTVCNNLQTIEAIHEIVEGPWSCSIY